MLENCRAPSQMAQARPAGTRGQGREGQKGAKESNGGNKGGHGGAAEQQGYKGEGKGTRKEAAKKG